MVFIFAKAGLSAKITKISTQRKFPAIQYLKTVSIDSHKTLFLASPFHYIVISAKQFDATIMNISSLDNEVFPLEEDLLNYTQHIIPALISIPPEVLLGRECLDGELKEC